MKLNDKGLNTMPKIDLGRLYIDQVIVHEIPKRKVNDHIGTLPLSQIPAPKDKEILNFLRERVIDSLGKHGIDIEIDEKISSPISEWIIKHLENSADLVQMSHAMAWHLHKQQTGVNPAGLLTVGEATYIGKPALLVMKLQREEGVRFQHIDIKGKQTLGLEHLRELLLTQQTRVFKAALFMKKNNLTQGILSDEQVKNIAGFFMRGFLGCMPTRNPDILTRSFFNTVSNFITNEVSDPEQQLRYHSALQTEINSHRRTIRPRDWISDYIDLKHRAHIEKALLDVDIPIETFHKDASKLSHTNLSRTSAKTARGLSLIGDTEIFREIVNYDEINGQPTIVIQDHITKLTS